MPEQVLMRFHPSRLAFWKWYLIIIIPIIIEILFLLNVVSLDFLKGYEIYFYIILTAIAITLIVISEIRKMIRVYTITNYRLIEKTGLFSVSETSVPWDKISNYTVTQNMLDKLFRIGSIYVEGIGGDQAVEIGIKKVSNVIKVKGLIEALIQRSKGLR